MKKIPFTQTTNQLPAYFPETIQPHAFIFQFAPNELIQKEAEDVQYLFYLLKGKAKILKSQENGRQMIVQFLEAGDFIGELSLIQEEKHTKNVMARNNVCCLAIPIRKAQQLLMNDTTFLQEMSRYIGVKLLMRVEHFTENQLYPLTVRLIDLLLTISIEERYEEKQTEIAEYLGVSYRHLLYTMQQLRKLGYIEKKKGYYLIHRDALIRYRATLIQ